ncbi:hypothetical protein BD770DRAFT_382920 [Pilaira anomala]|nr:hypothetical protein BD770DRAFT_382920 [Pilaira anomala]
MSEINEFLATVGNSNHASVTAAASSVASYLSDAKASINNEVEKNSNGMSHSANNSPASHVPENASEISKLDIVGGLPGLVGGVLNAGGNIVDGAAGAAIGLLDGVADAAAGLVNGVTGGALGNLAGGAANLVHDVAGTAGGVVAGATNAVDGVGSLVDNIIGGVLGGGLNGAAGGLNGVAGGLNGAVGGLNGVTGGLNGAVGGSGSLGGVSGGSGGSGGSYSISYGVPNDGSSGVVFYPGSGPLKRAIYNMNGEYSDVDVAPPASNEYVAQDESAAPSASASSARLVLKARAKAISAAHSSYLSSISA